jgi:gluconolactonase
MRIVLRRSVFIIFVLILIGTTVFGQQPAATPKPPSPDDQYVLGPDSQVQPDVPKGKIFKFTFDHSKIFPGTSRTITVYVPAQYKADKPACVYVGLDSLGFQAPVVFDNLIHKNEMPVTIAIGVSSGNVESAKPPDNPRFNRSFEFDGLNDNLARFLLEEIFPAVESQKTPDGLAIVLSKDANDRAAGGGSTGGIGAFTLAWERPDQFRRVFTAIGTFVGMRGGDHYPILVRKTEPKPIRIFMQDGANDQLPSLAEVGDWWMGNQSMQRALEFAGYSFEHIFGEGTHSGQHAASIFPTVMRWLWKDWPKPVTAGESQNNFLKAILQAGETWQLVPGSYGSAGTLAADRQGEVFFWDAAGRKTWKIAGDEKPQVHAASGKPYDGMAIGPDGRVYTSDAARARIVAYDATGKPSRIINGVRGQNLIVTHIGNLYVTELGGEGSGRIWLIKTTGQKSLLDTGLNNPSGIALSPDGLWLAVSENKTHWGYSYRVLPDGTVQGKQRFYWFHVPDEADNSGAGAWVMDRDGRLYSATRMGVQVFDRNGRVRAILPVPGGEVTSVSFGASNFGTLYVTCVDNKVYRRKVKVPGAPAWAPPIKLPPWGAG